MDSTSQSASGTSTSGSTNRNLNSNNRNNKRQYKNSTVSGSIDNHETRGYDNIHSMSDIRNSSNDVRPRFSRNAGYNANGRNNNQQRPLANNEFVRGNQFESNQNMNNRHRSNHRNFRQNNSEPTFSRRQNHYSHGNSEEHIRQVDNRNYSNNQNFNRPFSNRNNFSHSRMNQRHVHNNYSNYRRNDHHNPEVRNVHIMPTYSTSNVDDNYGQQNQHESNGQHLSYRSNDTRNNLDRNHVEMPPRFARIQNNFRPNYSESNNQSKIRSPNDKMKQLDQSFKQKLNLSSKSTDALMLRSNNPNNRDHKQNLAGHFSTVEPVVEEENNFESQREIMDDLLRKDKYECIVCCESIKIQQKTWNCHECYNTFHLKCIQMWARSSNVNENRSSSNAEATGSGQSSRNDDNRRHSHINNGRNNSNNVWRCPTCQDVQNKFPYAYYCFCRKTKEPERSNYHVPHSCGETCSRPLSKFNLNSDSTSEMFPCPHKCTLMCHPGKCAPCQSKIERSCSCTKTKIIMNCVSKLSDLVCEETCNKPLSCGKHVCEKKCHYGQCEPCKLVFDLKCFCGKQTRSNQTCSNELEMFQCEEKCGKELSCGYHDCEDQCHPGECGICPFDPTILKKCPCDQTLLEELMDGKVRVSCLDPIPMCKKICGKRYKCGTDFDPHYCINKCHPGSCVPCELRSIRRCECGANTQKIECKQLNADFKYRCKRRCNKKLSCGRHKCLTECCTDTQHICQQVCSRKLACGTHHCAEQCHSICKPCPNVIWTEVYCNCGSEVLYPPLPCGTKRPQCNRPCARVHSCGHQQIHTCHDDSQCPPCTEFVEKMCYGQHELCNTVHCYQNGVSCGRFCMKTLNCTLHQCVKICHAGDCPPCTQRCTKIRNGCEHQCGLPCHQANSTECPDSKCGEKVKVFCKCKLKVETMPCHEVNDPRKFQASVESILKRYNYNSSFTINEAMEMVRYNAIHQLECDETCSKSLRNKKLAEALGVDERQLDSVPLKYSDQLKTDARANPQLISFIHERLVTLVNNAKKNNLNKTVCHNFAPMNRKQREIIHCYSAHFGCKTESVDREPNRSVVVTAGKASFIPTVSLLQAVNIDSNQFKPKQSIVKVKLSSEENKDRKIVDNFNLS